MLDEIKDKAKEVYDEAKHVASKAVEGVKDLTGVGEVQKIHGQIEGQLRKTEGLNYFHEDDGK